MPHKFSILNVNISAINMDDACFFIEKAIAEKQKVYICVCPVSTIMECKKSETVLRSVNSAGLATPDGMPVVWIGKMLGHKKTERVYGPDLMRKICYISSKKGYKNYFYGSSSTVLNKLRTSLNIDYPGLAVSGTYAPPFRPLSKAEDNIEIQNINNCNPDIVWVGLGSPKQDLWMFNHREYINAPVMIGVGAAFDFIAKTKPQAPYWIRHSGLEWIFRLASEPKRLWRRYLINNFLFIYFFGLELLAKTTSLLKRKLD